jgi:hypothetical protein
LGGGIIVVGIIGGLILNVLDIHSIGGRVGWVVEFGVMIDEVGLSGVVVGSTTGHAGGVISGDISTIESEDSCDDHLKELVILVGLREGIEEAEELITRDVLGLGAREVLVEGGEHIKELISHLIIRSLLVLKIRMTSWIKQ